MSLRGDTEGVDVAISRFHSTDSSQVRRDCHDPHSPFKAGGSRNDMNHSIAPRSLRASFPKRDV